MDLEKIDEAVITFTILLGLSSLPAGGLRRRPESQRQQMKQASFREREFQFNKEQLLRTVRHFQTGAISVFFIWLTVSLVQLLNGNANGALAFLVDILRTGAWGLCWGCLASAGATYYLAWPNMRWYELFGLTVMIAILSLL